MLGEGTRGWEAAEDYCQTKGGHLASVTTEHIHNYLNEADIGTHINGMWIGGVVEANRGQFVWSDCSPWDFTMWETGNPTQNKDDNCISLSRANQKWRNRDCTQHKSYICSQKLCELIPVSAKMSSTYPNDSPAAKCIDGDTTNGFCGTIKEKAPWLAIELPEKASVYSVVIYNRKLATTGDRFRNAEIRVTSELPSSGATMYPGGELLGTFQGPGEDGQGITIIGETPGRGRYVLVQKNNTGQLGSNRYLSLHEVQVIGTLSATPQGKQLVT